MQPGEVLADPALEARARALSAELRCMVCQNQSIDDSDAELAHDLRVLVRERLAAGDSDEEVLDYVVSRYGEFVLLKPRFSMRNALLWGTPVLLLLGGGAILFLSQRSRRPAAPKLSDEEAAELDRILDSGQAATEILRAIRRTAQPGMLESGSLNSNTSCGSAKPFSDMTSEADRCIARQHAGDFPRTDGPPVERLGDAFEAAEIVHRRADHGEVQPVGAADIAVDDRADMQRRDEAHACRCRVRKGARDGPCGAQAGILPSVAIRRKDRKHAVADEFQHIAALRTDGLDDDLEIGAQPFEQGIRLQPLRQAGRIRGDR